MGFGDSYQPPPFNDYEINEDLEDDEDDSNKIVAEPLLEHSKSHKPHINHIPFPNEALLEKLSN